MLKSSIIIIMIKVSFPSSLCDNVLARDVKNGIAVRLKNAFIL